MGTHRGWRPDPYEGQCQDAAWNNITPDRILDCTFKLKNLSSLEVQQKTPEYHYDQGCISFHLTPDFVEYDQIIPDWYECIITVRYMVNGQTYISLTGLVIMERPARQPD